MIRRLFLTLFLFLFALSLLPATGLAAYKPEYKLSVVVAQNNPWGGAAQKFADLVRERTGGKINIKCYFAGQLFAGCRQTSFSSPARESAISPWAPRSTGPPR